MEHLTRNCKTAGHPEIRFSVSDESGLSGEWLRDYFESQVSNGQRFQDNETVQIGWMIVKLKTDSSGALELWEPDFDSMPIKWSRTVNNTLRHLIIQRAICNELGCEPDFASLLQTAVVGSNFLDNPGDFVMSRDNSAGADSGWLFRRLDDHSVEAEVKSLYEISLHRRSVIPFLALPAGATVECTGQIVKISFADKQITSRTSDVLHKISDTPK